ncbi:YkgJ family cysteine cluster protein [Thermodesulfobacteriota bacterium]
MIDPGEKGSNGSQCRRCGECCRKGGPALHFEDLQILQEGNIGYQHLTTIRKGEFAYSPLSERFEPTNRELVKLSGQAGEWTCCFFDAVVSGCNIYSHRPVECRLLNCSDPSAVKEIIGQSTLARKDIINPEDPLLQIIEDHDRECSCEVVNGLVSVLEKGEHVAQNMEELTRLVRHDLEIRGQAIKKYGLSLERELFALGRPLFLLLSARGFVVEEKEGEIYVYRK